MVDNEEVLLCIPNCGDNKIHLVLAEDTHIPLNFGKIVSAEIHGPGGLGEAIMELTTEFTDALVHIFR